MAFHALQALYFHLAVFVLAIIGVILIFVLVGIPFLILLGLAALVMPIIAAIRANGGEWYQIPFVGALARQNYF